MSMMVNEIEKGFLLDGEVAFSPQVAIGPHRYCQLNKPLTLSLPLDVTGKVTVLVSKTTAGSDPQWQVVPDNMVTVYSDHVDVETFDHCVYQAQCGCNYVVKLSFEYVYFSVSVKFSELHHSLLLRCSSDREVCTKPHGDYQLCHSKEETVRIRAVNGDSLHISMKSSDGSIQQLTTLFDLTKELRCALNEQFTISTQQAPSQSRKRRRGSKWRQRFNFFRLGHQSSGGNSRQLVEDELLFFWLIELQKKRQPANLSNGNGLLMVQSAHLSLVEEAVAGGVTRNSKGTRPRCHSMEEVNGALQHLLFSVGRVVENHAAVVVRL